MYSTGAYTASEIADWMNSHDCRTNQDRRFSKDSVRDMLQNVFYSGFVLYKGAREDCKGTSYRNKEGVLSKGLQQAAVDEELFNKCQMLRKKRANLITTKQWKKKVYILAGTLKCDYCGRNLRAQSALNGSRYYRDTSKIRGFNDCIVEKNSKKSINAEIVEKQLEKIIEQLVLPESWKSEIQKLSSIESIKTVNVNLQKNKIQQQINRTMENYELGYYKDKVDLYKQKIHKLQEELENLQVPTNHEVQQAAEIILSIKEVWLIATANEKEKLVKMIFKEVGVSISEGKIVWIKPQFGFEKLFSVIHGFVLNEKGRFLIG